MRVQTLKWSRTRNPTRNNRSLGIHGNPSRNLNNRTPLQQALDDEKKNTTPVYYKFMYVINSSQLLYSPRILRRRDVLKY